MANKEVCPTCGSDDKAICLEYVYGHRGRFLCADPWHKVDSLPVEADECTCGLDPKHDHFAPPWGHHPECPYRRRPGVEAPSTGTLPTGSSDPRVKRQEISNVHSVTVAGVEAKPASTLTALDDGRYDEPASKEEEDGTDSQRSDRRKISVDIGGHATSGDIDRAANSPKAVKRFTIEVLQEKNGRWLADIPSVPGAMAYGLFISVAVLDALRIRSGVLAESRAEKKAAGRSR